jgi:hypothetical protein
MGIISNLKNDGVSEDLVASSWRFSTSFGQGIGKTAVVLGGGLVLYLTLFGRNVVHESNYYYNVYSLVFNELNVEQPMLQEYVCMWLLEVFCWQYQLLQNIQGKIFI